jgi:acylphosphatase
MIVARRFLVAGRVQAVGFRFFLQDAAAREGITGVARNLSDGRLEVVAEGEAEAVSRFEWAVYHGPPRARVDRVETEVLPPAGRYPGFSSRD